VEDTSAFGPVTVKATGIEESVALFEQEVISDELVLLSRGHGAERVESTFKLTLEGVTGLNDLLLNLIALLTGDSRAKRVVGKVTADADTG